jgi:ABC-type Fe3+-hydroxamate transport system substrate-binding protein
VADPAGGATDAAPRIVSLVPSLTESLLAWGVVPVAVTRFCEQPGLATVGGTKDPDVPAIVALRPDLVVVNEEENRLEDVRALEEAGVPVHPTRVRSVGDVEPCLRDLAAAVGAERPAAELAASHRIDIESVDAVADRRAVFVPIWRRPWTTLNADTYGSSVLERLGLANVYAEVPDRYPTVTLDQVARRRPQVVLLPSEPYPFRERHLAELAALDADARLVDGRDLFWWGTRTAGALDRLRQSVGA